MHTQNLTLTVLWSYWPITKKNQNPISKVDKSTCMMKLLAKYYINKKMVNISVPNEPYINPVG